MDRIVQGLGCLGDHSRTRLTAPHRDLAREGFFFASGMVAATANQPRNRLRWSRRIHI